MYEQDARYIELYNSPFLLDQKAILVLQGAGASAVYAQGFGLQAGQRPASAGHFIASYCLRPEESCTAKVAQP
ncbi:MULTISPECIES: hypothetical protein [unclassified Sphingobacterium]|uniref:hypothetical protein n=1 Tax=unclassified Sphingobacterium TaxID=2609468 RepID=UPI0025E053E4|nr:MULTISPECIES: hypothetical protein [unclassified Sphingobacterium]